jgi:7,8-dihydro-6-hydroxymethylpterin dimethyltransferase
MDIPLTPPVFEARSGTSPLVPTLAQRARRVLDHCLVAGARPLFHVADRAARKFARAPFQPRWAPGKLQRHAERTSPPLGWPRNTDSLCPHCVREARTRILAGENPSALLRQSTQGEIRAQIVERDGQIWMLKECAEHGTIEDLISMDPAFMARIERLFPGRDFETEPSALRQHGSSTIKYGRGAVLTVDLTNRCNMMCDPCFMDANQVGFVHELQWDELDALLLASLSIKPRRQMSIQFSGGEPTLSPHFLAAVRRARELGYFAVQAASNGIRFAQEPELCHAAKAAGLRICYLQFDGVTNEANSHRKVGNLFDVKLRAIENLHAAGIDVVLVVTIVRGVNDHQVGPIIQFAADNADKITVVSFQPVSFTGRDEEIDDARRHAQRYTLSHLAHDVSTQLGVTEPLRDWFPLSAMNPLSDLVDLLLGKDQDFGALNCGCHPNCGIGTVLLVHKQSGQTVPVSEFLNLEQLLVDVRAITNAGQSRAAVTAQIALALARNFVPSRAPAGYGLRSLFTQFMSQTGAGSARIGQTEGDAKAFPWRLLFIAGMWFQDLFNYDFRRTEMCIIPYATQEGEISFCAYNTGVGWRQVVEKMHRTATVRDWNRQHGKHPVFAKQQTLPLPTLTPSTRLRDEAARAGRRHLPLVRA